MGLPREQWTDEEREVIDVMIAATYQRRIGSLCATAATGRLVELLKIHGAEKIDEMWKRISQGKTLWFQLHHNLTRPIKYPGGEMPPYWWR